MRFVLLFVSAMASVAFAAPLDGSDIRDPEAVFLVATIHN